jgi:hypothetical protein
LRITIVPAVGLGTLVELGDGRAVGLGAAVGLADGTAVGLADGSLVGDGGLADTVGAGIDGPVDGMTVGGGIPQARTIMARSGTADLMITVTADPGDELCTSSVAQSPAVSISQRSSSATALGPGLGPERGGRRRAPARSRSAPC